MAGPGARPEQLRTQLGGDTRTRVPYDDLHEVPAAGALHDHATSAAVHLRVVQQVVHHRGEVVRHSRDELVVAEHVDLEAGGTPRGRRAEQDVPDPERDRLGEAAVHHPLEVVHLTGR